MFISVEFIHVLFIFISSLNEFIMDKKELIKKIEQLPRKYSIVLSHILIEEFSHAEAAETIGCSEAEVRKQCDEALALLSE